MVFQKRSSAEEVLLEIEGHIVRDYLTAPDDRAAAAVATEADYLDRLLSPYRVLFGAHADAAEAVLRAYGESVRQATAAEARPVRARADRLRGAGNTGTTATIGTAAPLWPPGSGGNDPEATPDPKDVDPLRADLRRQTRRGLFCGIAGPALAAGGLATVWWDAYQLSPIVSRVMAASAADQSTVFVSALAAAGVLAITFDVGILGPALSRDAVERSPFEEAAPAEHSAGDAGLVLTARLMFGVLLTGFLVVRYLQFASGSWTDIFLTLLLMCGPLGMALGAGALFHASRTQAATAKVTWAARVVTQKKLAAARRAARDQREATAGQRAAENAIDKAVARTRDGGKQRAAVRHAFAARLIPLMTAATAPIAFASGTVANDGDTVASAPAAATTAPAGAETTGPAPPLPIGGRGRNSAAGAPFARHRAPSTSTARNGMGLPTDATPSEEAPS